MPHINPEHIDTVMSPEYTAVYETSIEKAKGSGFDLKNDDDMIAFAKNAKLTSEDVKLLETRQEINNQYGKHWFGYYVSQCKKKKVDLIK